MNLRHPIVAGSYYEATTTSCRHHAEKLLESVQPPDSLPKRLYGGLVPHAGWVYSGRMAALTLKTLLAGDGSVGTVILLAAHVLNTVRFGQVYDAGSWRTPLGDVGVDDQLAAELIRHNDCLKSTPQAHDYDPSLEVQLPLLQVLNPSIRIVPIAVPPTPLAIEIGRVLAAVLAKRDDVRIIGSTDLTHHAGHFPAPGGRGIQGVQWTEKNDRRMLELVEHLAADKIIPEYQAHGNACGAGAIAAAITAAKTLGATRGICLGYTNSYRVIHEQFPNEGDDTTVGYASVVFG